MIRFLSVDFFFFLAILKGIFVMCEDVTVCSIFMEKNRRLVGIPASWLESVPCA